MIIRKLIPQDKEELKKLLWAFYIEDIKRFSDEVQKFEAYKNDQKTIEKTAIEYLSEDKNKFITYVAAEEYRLMGFIRGEIKNKPDKKNYYKEGYIQDWFVEPENQGKKIGKELFNKLVEKFKLLGCTHVLLDTLIENITAQEIYHKMGFKDKALMLVKEL